MRKLYYITGTRADYGLMRNTLMALNADPQVQLSLIVTGMHLDSTYGNTLQEIQNDKLTITSKIHVPLKPQTGATMAHGISLIIDGCINILSKIPSNALIVLGDRGEMLAATIAAIHLNLHVIHIHGGERSGTIDESIRHAISKLAHYHFVATKGSKERLINMGENQNNIFITGAPGLEGIVKLAKYNRETLCSNVGFNPGKKIVLFLLHSVLQDTHDRYEETKYFLECCLNAEAQVVCLMPNCDAGGEEIRAALNTFKNNPHVHLQTHMRRDIFVSWMACCDLMIGNSSSGIIEAASFGTPVINIGTRQNLRERNANIIDVSNKDPNFFVVLEKQLHYGRYPKTNIYERMITCRKIVEIIKNLNFNQESLNKINTY